MEIIDQFCELVYKRKFKQAEEVLLGLVENNNTEAIKTLYLSFNNYYYRWAKKHKINTRLEQDRLNHQDHSNFLISHMKNVAEMDDLMYGVLFGDQKEEILYNLRCYKNN